MDNGVELEFRDGKFVVPEHLAALMTGMDTTMYRYQQAVDSVNSGMLTEHLGKVQHPLVVLLLIIAGAILQPGLAGIWLFAPYVAFRTTGKLSGGWLASRLTDDVAPSELGAYLIIREFARERGNLMFIDGLHYLHLPLIDRNRLGADLVKENK